MRLKSIPTDKDTSLFSFFCGFCSDKFCFPLNVLFFLINKPFFT